MLKLLPTTMQRASATRLQLSCTQRPIMLRLPPKQLKLPAVALQP